MEAIQTSREIDVLVRRIDGDSDAAGETKAGRQLIDRVHDDAGGRRILAVMSGFVIVDQPIQVADERAAQAADEVPGIGQRRTDQRQLVPEQLLGEDRVERAEQPVEPVDHRLGIVQEAERIE